MQDATRIILGGTLSSAKTISRFNSDPASFLAGRRVCLGSDGGLSLLKSAGFAQGISLGKDLSDCKWTSVVRDGLKVPIAASLKRASGTVTITSYANLVSGTDDALAIAGTSFVAQAGAATPGDATFQAATSNDATATSLATQINAHATVALKVYAVAAAAVVTLYSVAEGIGSTGTGNDIAVAYTDNDTNVGLTLAGLSGGKLSGGSDTASDIAYATAGTKVYINDVSGKADIAMTGFSTITDAIYCPGGGKIGVKEDATVEACILADMVGGL